ncbi:MAG: TonB-dependent receptor, partial [Gemmatimonadota bacterium]
NCIRVLEVVARRSLVGMGLCALVALVPSTAAAQTGQVVGQALASTGEVIPFAAVQWQGSSAWTTVRADGQFVLTGVPTGAQTIIAQALGYRTARQTVTVSDGGTVNVNFTLETRPLDVAGISVAVLRPDLSPVAELEDREVREANPKDVGELLRNMDGVDAVRRGPLGLDPVVRGLRETEVGTYLDGTRLEPAGPARMDSPLTHLDPSAVRSVEVIKGPYALTWGSGNLSAIRVETQDFPDTDSRPRGTVAGGYDTNTNAAETSLSVHGRSGIVGYTLDAAWREGDNYTAGANDTLPDASLVIPGEYHSKEARGKVGFNVSESGELTVAGGYQEQGPMDYPGRLLTAESFKAPNFWAGYEWSGEGTLSGIEAKAYRNHVDHTMSNRGKPTAMDMPGRTPPFALDVHVDSKINVLGGNARANLNLGGPWTAEVGGDVVSTNRDATRYIWRQSNDMLLFETNMWPDATITDVGGFAKLDWRQGGVSFSGTARVDYVDATAPLEKVDSFFVANAVPSCPTYPAPCPDLESTETNLSGAVTGSFDLDENWVFALGVGSAVRTADATERYSDRIPATKAQFAAEFMGDPQLKPERSNQGDVWLDGRYDNWQVHFGAFYRKVNDYITVEPTSLPRELPLSPTTVFRYINGEATFYGLDGSAVVGLTDELTASATGAYLYGQDDQLDEPALGVSPLRGTLGLRYEEPMGRFYLEAKETLVGKQDRVSTTRNEGATPGYQTADIRGGVGLPGGVTVRGGVLNVFDKYYWDHLNARNPFGQPAPTPVPEPGRIFFLDLAIAF